MLTFAARNPGDPLSDIVEISGKLGSTLEAEKKQHGKLWRHREQAFEDREQKDSEINDAIRAIVERLLRSPEERSLIAQGQLCGYAD